MDGFISEKHRKLGWQWSDGVDKSGWTASQKGYFLARLPFSSNTWRRAEPWLGDRQSEYWSRINANAYLADDRPDFAIDKLIEYGRPHAAIYYLYMMYCKRQTVGAAQCVKALLAAVASNEPPHSMSVHYIVELIKFLQSEPSVAQEDILRVEFAYLVLLDRHSGATPKFLERKLASDPEFFCEIIQRIYRSAKENQPAKDLSEQSQEIATNAWRLLNDWKIPPGLMEDGIFKPEKFNRWLDEVTTICMESGHLDVALRSIGSVLVHAPDDPDGLWIHKTIAEALNNPDTDYMRNGYRVGIYNSRGVHWVDPTGRPERELADQFREKAGQVENAGFHRLAQTLRSLGDGYRKEAEHIISEHQQEGPSG